MAVCIVKKDVFSECCPAYNFSISLLSLAGGEDDDHRGGDLCPLLAALSCLLYCDGSQQAAEQVEVHPAGLPDSAVAGNELHHVQPHHLLLPQQQVGTNKSPTQLPKHTHK